MTEYVKQVELKIEEIKKEVKAGVFVPKGREDILAKALGKAEHPGRVRGVPNGIGIKEYFGKAPKNPTPTQLKDKISSLEEQLKETQMMLLKFGRATEGNSNEARLLKTSATMITVDIEEHVLHIVQKCMLSYEDLIHWCDEEEISASHIALFMRYLTQLVESMQCTSLYGFLCPTSLSKFASFENEDDRSNYIVKAMTCTSCERGRKLVFAPYFEGNHWMLAAINPKDSVVYWCDPAGYIEPPKFLKDTINMAITKINSMDPLFGCHQQKQLEWKIIKCPTQPSGTVLCGYYVCRYMLEIIRGASI